MFAVDTITLEEYHGPWDPNGPNANFRQEVEASSLADPIPTLEGMSANLGIPVGAIARYVLVKWAASGSEGLMQLGPLAVRQMTDIVARAEREGTEEARLAAYHALAKMLSWLAVPIVDEEWRPGFRPRD